MFNFLSDKSFMLSNDQTYLPYLILSLILIASLIVGFFLSIKFSIYVLVINLFSAYVAGISSRAIEEKMEHSSSFLYHLSSIWLIFIFIIILINLILIPLYFVVLNQLIKKNIIKKSEKSKGYGVRFISSSIIFVSAIPISFNSYESINYSLKKPSQNSFFDNIHKVVTGGAYEDYKEKYNEYKVDYDKYVEATKYFKNDPKNMGIIYDSLMGIPPALPTSQGVKEMKIAFQSYIFISKINISKFQEYARITKNRSFIEVLNGRVKGSLIDSKNAILTNSKILEYILNIYKSKSSLILNPAEFDKIILALKEKIFNTDQ